MIHTERGGCDRASAHRTRQRTSAKAGAIARRAACLAICPSAWLGRKAVLHCIPQRVVGRSSPTSSASYSSSSLPSLLSSGDASYFAVLLLALPVPSLLPPRHDSVLSQSLVTTACVGDREIRDVSGPLAPA